MNNIEQLIARYPTLSSCKEPLEQAVEALVAMHRKGGTLLLCGNGGSAADCEHISGELLKGFISTRPLSEEERKGLPDEEATRLQGAIKAIPLPALISVGTAFANDVSAELSFAQLVWAFGESNGVFLGISTSGNAKNICAAAKIAQAKGMLTVAMTGKDGGELAKLCQIALKVPETETFKVQELHLPLYHALCAETEARIFGG